MVPPRSRFYAMIYAQLGGFLIVVSGMLFYWIGIGAARVPRTITWRVAATAVAVLLMALVPSAWNQARMIVRGLAGKRVDYTEPLADNPVSVRRLVWAYCYVDLGLLTYLVHITGGISGSMYAEVYLVIPAIALVMILDTSEVLRALWLIASATIGIILSYVMSRKQWVEFNAAQFQAAFDISLAFVRCEAIGIPILQVAVLWFQLEETTE